MDKDKNYLSASKIKTLTSCSWLYWCKYVLRLPEASNDGANRGNVCHLIFDVLGNPRHRGAFDAIIRRQDVRASPSVLKLAVKEARRLGVDDKENLDMIFEMILAGLNHDFFGLSIGKPDQSFSEFDFCVEKDEGDIHYNVIGFIDKLFLYNNLGRAVVRDFKTSKKMFVGPEINDNLQDWIYCLATKEKFPQHDIRNSEFLFLKFMDGKGGGIISMDELDDFALEAFEYELTHYQDCIDSFEYRDALSFLAANQGWPDDKTFSKRLQCGYATRKGQLKKDGSPMWHCPFKFPFDYYTIIDENGEVVGNISEDEFDESLVGKNQIYIKNT